MTMSDDGCGAMADRGLAAKCRSQQVSALGFFKAILVIVVIVEQQKVRVS